MGFRGGRGIKGYPTHRAELPLLQDFSSVGSWPALPRGPKGAGVRFGSPEERLGLAEKENSPDPVAEESQRALGSTWARAKMPP